MYQSITFTNVELPGLNHSFIKCVNKGVTFTFLKDKDFINASSLCSTHDKKVNAWFNLVSTKSKIEELKASEPGLNPSISIEHNSHLNGMYVHWKLLTSLCSWVSESLLFNGCDVLVAYFAQKSDGLSGLSSPSLDKQLSQVTDLLIEGGTKLGYVAQKLSVLEDALTDPPCFKMPEQERLLLTNNQLDSSVKDSLDEVKSLLSSLKSTGPNQSVEKSLSVLLKVSMETRDEVKRVHGLIGGLGKTLEVLPTLNSRLSTVSLDVKGIKGVLDTPKKDTNENKLVAPLVVKLEDLNALITVLKRDLGQVKGLIEHKSNNNTPVTPVKSGLEEAFTRMISKKLETFSVMGGILLVLMVITIALLVGKKA